MTLKEVFEVMDKFDKSALGELEVKMGDSSLTLKKPAPVAIMAGPAYAHAAPQIAHAPQALTADAAVPAAKKVGVEIITSPIVGTFYRSAAPDVPSFVEAGSKVDGGSTLCILEAMKVMNKLEAEYKLEIVSILVETGTMVEYGTPLFEVKRI